LAENADWEHHDLSAELNDDGNALEQWVAKHPKNLTGLKALAHKHLTDEEWKKAQPVLQKLIDLHPTDNSSSNPYEMLVKTHRELNQTEQERIVLERYSVIDADSVSVYLRLIEIAAEKEDWDAVLQNAQRVLAVNPLIIQAQRQLATASEKLKKNKTAINAYRALLVLDPNDPAETHYRLANLLHQRQDPTAKRHVLIALEEAPRFRKAHRLLLQIVQQQE